MQNRSAGLSLALLFNSLLALSVLADDKPKDVAVLHERIDSLLTKEFPADEPGAAILILRQGRVVLEKGYRLAHLNPKSPITPATNFDLASMSKQFTALAVMVLADGGKIGFDDDVRKYLPELQAHPGHRPVRIRDMLHHTSGLPDYLGFWETKFKDFTKLTNEGVVELLKGRKLDFPPGTKNEYSNTNYALLAAIVSRVSRRPFHEFMHDEVFHPLGMERTVVVDKMPAVVPGRATGYRRAGGKWEKAIMDGPVCGDGNEFSNLRDLAKWDAAVAAETLAKPPTWRAALTSGKLDNGKETGYGFGWGIENRNGQRFVGHNGGWAGTRTIIGRWIEDRITIVVLSNNERIKPEEVQDRIAEIVFGKTAK
jgi:CubicO group peptidase (beta-lactamase class C family)